MIAFYPIKKKYTDKIMSGEKRCELRKRLPNSNLKYILIYATTPMARVIGYAEVKELHKNSVLNIWNRFSNIAGISRKDYFEYFSNNDTACLIELSRVYKFVRPFKVSEISEEFRVPQSFCYIDEDIFKRIKRRKVVKV